LLVYVLEVLDLLPIHVRSRFVQNDDFVLVEKSPGESHELLLTFAQVPASLRDLTRKGDTQLQLTTTRIITLFKYCWFTVKSKPKVK
jgi:hypothetical protein